MLPVLETALDFPVMDVSFYLTVGVEPVSANRTPGFHRRSDEAMKRCPVEIGDSCHADATDAFAVLLGCDDDQHLAVDQAAGCSPRFGCPPVGFIYLHHASQTLPAGAHHRLAQLVEHQPRRLVAAQSKNPLEAKRAHSILLAGHVPHRSKPYRQGKMSVLKHGSREHRHLRPTACAKPKSARNRPSILALASRATKACRPAQREKILPTRGIIAKAPLQFHQCARVILGHSRPLYLGGG